MAIWWQTLRQVLLEALVSCQEVYIPSYSISVWRPKFPHLFHISITAQICPMWFLSALGKNFFFCSTLDILGILCWYGFLPIAGNVGADHAIFEQGASAGNVGNERIVEKKKANPVALLLSSAMMLRHLQFPSFADRLETAVNRVIAEGKYRTKDLGGSSTTQEVVDAVIAMLDGENLS